MAATPMYVSIFTQITNFTRHHDYVFARVDIILYLCDDRVTLKLFRNNVVVLNVTHIPPKFECPSEKRAVPHTIVWKYFYAEPHNGIFQFINFLPRRKTLLRRSRNVTLFSRNIECFREPILKARVLERLKRYVYFFRIRTFENVLTNLTPFVLGGQWNQTNSNHLLFNGVNL